MRTTGIITEHVPATDDCAELWRYTQSRHGHTHTWVLKDAWSLTEVGKWFEDYWKIYESRNPRLAAYYEDDPVPDA